MNVPENKNGRVRGGHEFPMYLCPASVTEPHQLKPQQARAQALRGA
ncbi:hypothetical protein [Paraburkholderia sp. BR10954]